MDFINKLNIESSKRKYLNQLAGKIKKLMKVSLFAHSINTLKFANQIAEKQKSEIDIYRLSVSCLLHDYGKIFDREQLKAIIREHHPEVSSQELKFNSVLHAIAGDFLVSRDFDISDKKILNAIRYHTTGYCDMNTEDKILLIADKAEEGRIYGGASGIRGVGIKKIKFCFIKIY